MGVTEWEDRLELLTSNEFNKKYTVEYTFTVDGSTVGTYTQTGATLVEFEDYNIKTYTYGKRLGYNRIESLSEYHNNNEFTNIKMYKGNIYADADKISELGGKLSIPNVNNSLLYDLNSIGAGYNLLNIGLPDPVDTKEEAVSEFIELMTGKRFNIEDFISFAEWLLYYDIYRYNINTAHVFYVEDDIVYINAVQDPVKIMKAVDSADALSYLETCKEYLDFVSESIEYNNYAYELMSEDGVLTEVDLFDAYYMVWEIWYVMKSEQVADASELPDTYYLDYYADGRKSIEMNKVTSFIPIEKEISAQSLSDFYTYETIDVYEPDEIESVLSDLGLAKDSLKVYEVTKSQSIDSTDTIADDLVDCLKEDFGSEVYEAFCEYIINNFVTYNATVTSIKDNDNSQKNTDVDVYGDELEIPLELLDTANLGEINEISQLWYAGNMVYYLLQYEGYSSERAEMLHHGALIYTNITSYRAGSSYGESVFEKMYSLEYDELYKTSLGSVIFAKVPDQIEEQDRIVTEEAGYEIEWDVPADNGAEILGYQIAIVPKDTLPAESDYITTGDGAGSYTDLGDSYTIKWTTDATSYIVETYGKSVDVYIRAVNVIGSAEPQKISIVNPYDITISGADSVKAGETSGYDTLNINGTNVEDFCTYQLKDNPKSVTIDSKGNLYVSGDCSVSEVTIISTGNDGTPYAGKSAEKTVKITKTTVNPGDSYDTVPNPDGDSSTVLPVGDSTPVIPLGIIAVNALMGTAVCVRFKRF